MDTQNASRSLLGMLLLGLLSLLLVPSASAQTLDDMVRYSERLPAPGGPALGRGGGGLFAGTASPGALFGNPAGLGWMSSSMITGDLAINRAREENQFRLPGSPTSSDRTVNDYRLGRLAGAYTFPTQQGSFVIAGSFHQSNTYDRGFNVQGTNQANSITGTFLPTSNGFEVDGEDLIFDRSRARIAYESGAIDFSDAVFQEGGYPFFQAANPASSATDGQLVLEQQDDVLETGQMNEVSVGAAVAVAPRVMVGGGLNIVFGEYTFERFFRETDASGLQPPANPDNPQTPYDPYFLAGTNLEGFDEFQLEERIRTDLSGVNLRFGLSARLLDGLRGGFHVETPTWLTLTETFGTQMRTFFDCDFSSGGCVRPDAPLSSGSLTDNEFEYRINTPPRLGVGLQYAQGGLMLAGGIEVVDWTQAEFDTDNGNSDSFIRELNRELESLDETVNTRVGAQYTFDALTLRAGLMYQPDPLDESFQDLDSNSTDGDQLFLSAGLGYALSDRATLNVNWAQERFDDQFRSYSSLSGPSPTVRESVTRNRVLIGLTYQY